MSDYLLDTNHASSLVTRDHPVRTRVDAAIEASHRFFLTPMVVAEAIFGFSMLPRAVQNRQEWERLRPTLLFINVEERDAIDAAFLQTSLRKRGRQLLTVDALIASVAVRYNLTLLTSDRDFSWVPGLTTANWVVRPAARP